MQINKLLNGNIQQHRRATQIGPQTMGRWAVPPPRTDPVPPQPLRRVAHVRVQHVRLTGAHVPYSGDVRRGAAADALLVGDHGVDPDQKRTDLGVGVEN